MISKKVILIYANCVNPNASGDFAFAGNLAKDFVNEIQQQQLDFHAILVSTFLGVKRFEKIYGQSLNGQVMVDGVAINMCSLELFDGVANQVVAFIEANRCKYPPSLFLKRALSPDTQLLIIQNLNTKELQEDTDSNARQQLAFEQPEVFNLLDPTQISFGVAGFTDNRLGLPSIAHLDDLPSLNEGQMAILPEKEYGFIYVNVDECNYVAVITQYLKLSKCDQHVLIGNCVDKKGLIESMYRSDMMSDSLSTGFPKVDYYQSVPNILMRHLVAKATRMVVSTGVTSTLEALQEGKLTFYQDMPNNKAFVASYLLAVKSMVSSECDVGCMPDLIMELSHLLFAPKPLNPVQMNRAQALLSIDALKSRLGEINQSIIKKGNGKIAPRLLSFIGGEHSVKSQVPSVLNSLRTEDEKMNPSIDEALRRAAGLGLLFELKVLLKSTYLKTFDMPNSTSLRTALHFAVAQTHWDCVRCLIAAGASLDVRDSHGMTPLHYAIMDKNEAMVDVLIEAGASLDVVDNTLHTPKDYADDWMLLHLESGQKPCSLKGQMS